MNQALARVIETQLVYERTYLQWYSSPEVGRSAQLGQFVMLRCRDEQELDPLLPRAMSFHRVRGNGQGEWAILFTVVGRGTEWLSRRRPGDMVGVFGPLGRGFAVKDSSRNLLLVAGGIGIAPLVWLAEDAVAKGQNVMLLAGARTAAQVFPAELLPSEVELVVTTEDGSLGRRGLVSEALAEYLPWCDQAFACGPNPMFKALAEIRRKAGLRKPVQILMEERMCCGTGVCYSCAVFARKGPRLVCKDGPMFEIHEVF
ncbi:MAG TPA: dihydroorotate dehydrogenase electron transfer subunit [Dehalococcoidia bacterium]|nr:dihydroorotate dehydrogenase electron transfer subunit [Dehalococcoidia bacterium]